MTKPRRDSVDTCDFDAIRDQLSVDPYPTYHMLRSRSPVAWVEPHKFWMLTRYADVMAGFKDPRLGHGVQRKVPGEGSVEKQEPTPLMRVSGHWLIFKDPPDHTRMRRLMIQALGTVPHDEIARRTEAVCTRLLDNLGDRSRIDLMSEYAFLVPVLMIADLFGAPPEDHDLFVEWAKHLWGVLDLAPTADELERADQWVMMVEDYLRSLIARQREQPGNNLVSALLQARHNDQQLTEDEVLANSILMLFAGHDTVSHLLGNGMLALLQNPAVLAELAGDPDLDSAAIPELLRYDSPQQLAFRYALEDVEIGGVPIAAGDKICLAIGAANRDPAKFSDPDRLDLHRPKNPHLAFAAGIHRCVGLHLARIEAQVALRALVTRMPAMRLSAFEREHTILIRGLERLEVEVSRSP